MDGTIGNRAQDPTKLLPALARGPLLALAGAKLLVHVLVGSGYGFHQDEFYYLACGRRLAWGYVDQPPLVPLLGRLAETIFGGSALTPFELRWFSALAGAGTVFLTGLMARELGGGRFAQVLAALAALVMPLFLATGELFQTVVFDQLCWAGAFWLVLRTLRTGEGHGWLLVGLVTGAGLEVKHTAALFGAGLAAALLVHPVGRHHLRTPWPWLGGGLALALLVPNLLWQHAHGWPTAEFVRNNNAWNREKWTLPGFLGIQMILAGPGVAPLLALGVVWALRARRRGDGVGGETGAAAGTAVIISATVFAVLLVLRGKPYYVGAVYPALAALGGAGLEAVTRPRPGDRPHPARRWWRPGAVAVMVAGTVWLAPAVLPIVPWSRLAGSWEARVNGDLLTEVGWPELVAQVRATYQGLPADERARATILCVDYEEASAIEHFDPALVREAPVVSPHNTFWLWGPGPSDPQTVVVVGARHREWMEKLWGRVEQVGVIDNSLHVDNEERGRGLWICREPKQSLGSAWAGLKNFG